MFALHTIASTATVTLSGSNDNWATTAVSHAVPWAGRDDGAAVRVRHLHKVAPDGQRIRLNRMALSRRA